MAAHTPTPWQIKRWEFSPDGQKPFTSRELAVYHDPKGDGGGGYWEILVIPLGSEPTQNAEWEANAEFIVRACNAHEEFLEAAKAYLGVTPRYACWPRKRAPREALEAAVAKAEGGS